MDIVTKSEKLDASIVNFVALIDGEIISFVTTG